MNIYHHKTLLKIYTAFFCSDNWIIRSFIHENLVKSLKTEERKKVELWAEAERQLISSSDTSQNLAFLFSIIENNSTVPVILTDGNDSIISA